MKTIDNWKDHMFKYSCEIPKEITHNIVFDKWSKKEVFRGILRDCITYITNNNVYQSNYSKLALKTKKETIWVEDIRYYMGKIPLDDWRLCDIPNLRRNAKYH